MDPAHHEGTEIEKVPLPELKLDQKFVSKKPVTTVNRRGEFTFDEVTAEQYRDYYLFFNKGRTSIDLVGDDGETVEEFKNNSNRGTVDWNSYAYENEYFLHTQGSGHSVVEVEENRLSDRSAAKLPPHSKAYLEQIFLKERSGTGQIYISWLADKRFEYSFIVYPEATVVVPKPGYLLIYDKKSRGWIAWVTQNAGGVPLHPRNWQRLDSLQFKAKLPDGLLDDIQKLDALPNSAISVGSSLVAGEAEECLLVMTKDQKTEKFRDHISGIASNICTDPQNKNMLYYCRESNPEEIFRLDLGQPENTWHSEPAALPKQYTQIKNLHLDPSGNFFIFSTGTEMVILLKDTLQEVGEKKGLNNCRFTPDGRLFATNEQGQLVVFEHNLAEIKRVNDQNRVADVTKGITAEDLFHPERAGRPTTTQAKAPEGTFEHLGGMVQQYRSMFTEQLSKVQRMEDIEVVKAGLMRLKAELEKRLNPQEVDFITNQIQPEIDAKQKELGRVKATEITAIIKQKIAETSLSFARIADIRSDFDRFELLRAYLEPADIEEIERAEQEFNVRAKEFFQEHNEQVMTDVSGIVADTKKQLQALKSQSSFDTWMEVTRPQVRQRLMTILKSCPPEATDVCQKILASMDELEDLYHTYEQKFQTEYDKVREAASEVAALQVEGLQNYIDSFFARTGRRHFASPDEAQQYFEQSEDYKVIWQEIEALRGNNPDAAKIVERAVKSRAANFLGEVELSSKTQVAQETGRQMVAFGEVLFPKWEAKVKERKERKVNLVFIEDKTTRGPGVSADQIMGDVGIQITDAEGHVTVSRLYEGTDREDEWRLGAITRLGGDPELAVPPSYVSQADYRGIRQHYLDWAKPNSKIRGELAGLFEKCQEVFSHRPRDAEGRFLSPDDPESQEWLGEYKAAYEAYAKYAKENHVALLRQFELSARQPDREYINGKGFVPEWQGHWCMDAQTEKDLSTIAMLAGMQLELHEGIINLVGHAGTGKDVDVRMFAHRTNRPYFAMDCTKWTTEFELSEDVVLEAEGGATKTVKVPSVVLNGIRTPGAVMYFNEINGMPEQAQIFLHALFDEKRSITLKTSSGTTIQADPTVIFMSSMNPGYPGTFDPQYATRSRMVDVQINYPPLTRPKDPDDRNPRDPYNSSEALRMARSIDSLDDLTYDPNPKRNEFVKLWDRYVNGIQNGAPEPTQEQKFDMDTILALMTFGDNLRSAFMAGFERTGMTPNTLVVSQPLTSREYRRCAYSLSKIPATEKIGKDSDTLARQLLDTFFLAHIDNVQERDRARQAMLNWSSKKRV